jgi:UDP-glucose 4-epimerase
VRVVVTGGAGFIGSHVADAFLARGDEVLVIDDLSAGSRENVPERARLEQLDIVDGEQLRRTVAEYRPEAVCHLAAQASVTASVTNPRRDLDVNVAGTLNVCEAAKEVAARIVFASTGGALYGDGAPIPTSEDSPPEPLAPYGASKLAAEGYVATWGRLHGLPNVVLRLGNIYGPRQSPHGEAGVVAIFSERLLRGEPPVVYGNGRPTRDYVHVLDAADAFVRATAGEAGIFNVGSGRETSVLELLEILQRVSGNSVAPRPEPLRPGELRRSALESNRIEAALGWRARVPLDEGLAETFRSYAEASP